MTPKVRLWIYIAACVLAVIVAGLVLFGLVTTAQVKDSAVVLAIVYAAVSALAAGHVNQ